MPESKVEETFVAYELCCTIDFYLTSSAAAQTALQKRNGLQVVKKQDMMVQISLLNKLF